MIQFSRQNEFAMADLIDFIQEEVQNIQGFNRTYPAENIAQLLLDMKNWHEPRQDANDSGNDVIMSIHSPTND